MPSRTQSEGSVTSVIDFDLNNAVKEMHAKIWMMCSENTNCTGGIYFHSFSIQINF